MNKQNTEYLFTLFEFFHPEASLRESLMAFGFECGDGWFPLIKKLCEDLRKLKLKNFRVAQVKEKYGGLRFYVCGVETKKADRVYKLISRAEAKSLKICENCGKSGKPNKTGWIITLCGRCREQLKNM